MSADASNKLVTAAGIEAARTRIADTIRVTPMLRKETLDRNAKGDVFLKCEHLQRTGSFKIRGAYNRLAQLSDSERANGVVAASAGNHAQGVAVAATEQKIAATIFMPEDASLSKVEATRSYGAEVRLVGEHLSNALEAAQQYAIDTGATFIHPFDHVDVIEGQGTVGLEILEQVPNVANIVCAVGGGGLLSGIAVAVKEQLPNCRIIAVQTAACTSFAQAIEAGKPVTIDAKNTMADGIAVKRIGDHTFAILRDLVDSVIEVEENDLSAAMLWGLERAKQLFEGAGAAGVAALLAGKAQLNDGPTVVVVGGGNVDPVSVIPVIRHGLTSVGRFLHVGTELPDRPGELSRLLALLAKLKVNILSVEHTREGVALHVGDTLVELTLQTRNEEHVGDVFAALKSAGYAVHRPV